MAVVLLGVLWWTQRDLPSATGMASDGAPAPAPAPVSSRESARLSDRDSGRMILVSGVVDRTLSDDHEGSRHQRFILRLPSGQTLLIAHNIDLAPRVAGLEPGQALTVHGEYEWNDRGGVVHWTHHDPRGAHPAGYIERQGIRYQ